MDEVGWLRFEEPLPAPLARTVARTLHRLPPVEGSRIHAGFQPQVRDRRRPAHELHAGAFLRRRRIMFDASLRRDPEEFSRILVHEVFHFAWVRAGNPARRSFEELVRCEILRGCRGEAGWSAEWRKQALSPSDPRQRTLFWREYICESFCDSAAWLYTGLAGDVTTLLPATCRSARRAWFAGSQFACRISI